MNRHMKSRKSEIVGHNHKGLRLCKGLCKRGSH